MLMDRIMIKISKYIIAIVCVLMVILTSPVTMHVQANGNVFRPSAYYYEDKTSFATTNAEIVREGSPSYGKAVGEIKISGANLNDGYNKAGYQAYTAEGETSFTYSFDVSGHQTDNLENWNLKKSDKKSIGDIKLAKQVASGAILVQKSYDASNWENAQDPIYDIFAENKNKLDVFFRPAFSDIQKGVYYRVLVAYEMRKKIGTKPGWWPGTKDPVYDDRYIVEAYYFYMTYSDNPIMIFDINKRITVAYGSTIANGFYVDTRGTVTSISIKKDNGKSKTISKFDSFFSPGNYQITVVSPVGESFSASILIEDGITTQTLTAAKYENEEKDGYSMDNAKSSIGNITSLKIGQKSGTSIKVSTKNSISAYGLTGDNPCLYLKVAAKEEIAGLGWEIVEDDWGMTDKQTIGDAWTGKIATGVILVQRSITGLRWTNIEDGKYAKGLYTTDFYTHYGGKGDVLVYTPDGEDILDGVYLRILYAYELKEINGKNKKRCVEEYVLYLCNNELGAVTFHNLTAAGKIETICGTDNEIEVDMYRSAETMNSGAVTTTGFTIDNSNNPTVTYTVRRNGVEVKNQNKTEFTETGKYDIQLTSAVGSTQSFTLYVDRMSPDETIQKYFGQGFIEGKRIYDETSQVPVFEGGETYYHFESISNYFLPLYGTVTNLSTGSITTIAASRASRKVELVEPGTYEVVLYNNPTCATQTPSGDNKVITFHFCVIPQGTAPGPQINKANLENQMRTNASGIYPKYYGLTYTSAAKGYITRAYASREDAIEAAKAYESGTVEVLNDGTYRYTGAFRVKQKDKYESNWELMDAVNYFAELAVEELYFDMSDPSTYATLRDSLLDETSNPRMLELSRSVVIFADDQRDKLTKIDALPILNALPYEYVKKGLSSSPDSGHSSFKFFRDEYGCDSDSVTISSSDGKQMIVTYGEDVDSQLKNAGFKTGILTITEQTVYGDQATYEAVYYANNDIMARIELVCHDETGTHSIKVSQENEGTSITTEAFSIISITDELDPYDLISIKEPSGRLTRYVADQIGDFMWTDVGEYEISVINRIGNKFSFKIEIDGSRYAALSFEGIGTEGFESLLLNIGDENVELPRPERYGYEFAGYLDDNGTLYGPIIDKVSFGGSKILSPTWNLKKVKVRFEDENGNEIHSQEVNFGSILNLTQYQPQLPNGKVFNGWIYRGSLVSDKTITIIDDTEMVFAASVSTVQTELVKRQNVKDEMVVDETKNKVNPIIFIVGLIVIAFIGICAYCLAQKRKKQH